VKRGMQREGIFSSDVLRERIVGLREFKKVIESNKELAMSLCLLE
jgi:hypothetical protein